MEGWQIWADTGGTFTDCLALDPQKNLHRLKVLSSAVLRGRLVRQLSRTRLKVEFYWPVPQDIYRGFQLHVAAAKKVARVVQHVDASTGIIDLTAPVPSLPPGTPLELSTGEEVPVFAARLLTQTPLGHSFPAIEMKLGSTRGTNAILERKGARTAFLVTEGFKDLLLIGTQQRPDLFALKIVKPEPLYEQVHEVPERINAQGAVLKKLDEAAVAAVIRKLKKARIESVAVALLNSFKNPIHERQIKTALVNAGFSFVSLSTELSGQIKILPRAETAIANAYLAPVIHDYIGRIQTGLANAGIKVMTSAGGLVDARAFFPKDSLLSGPAGGVVGAALTAQRSGIDKLITFDMGGTSTDVSLYNQRFDYRYESRVGDLKILSPSLAIDTIAAGGGSICAFDGYRFTVGPQSAGANPGPACYGAGGPLTITDVNLLLQRLDPAEFSIPLSVADASAALDQLIGQARKATGKKYGRQQVLRALIQIANEKMAEAIRKVSTQLGHDPADYTLLCFGGAGGQHACELATMLQMKRVLVPYDAGLLSALGIGHARVERFVEKLVLAEAATSFSSWPQWVSDLAARGMKQLEAEGFERKELQLDQALAFMRFRGQESSLEIDYHPGESYEEVRGRFRENYERIFGHWLDQRPIEVELLRVVVSVRDRHVSTKLANPTSYQPKPLKRTRSFDVYRWESLRPGARIKAPALIVSNNSTTVVDEGWTFVLDGHNNAHLAHNKPTARTMQHVHEAELELFTNRFTAVAQEMGAMLQRTSFSVNVKERLDFSCAVLDPDGYLVVNAPHIPVHLGSLGVCVREVMKVIELGQDDVVITNHPAFGGSHLPDVTLIQAVFVGRKRIGFVANRAHHAEIGGKQPGSMPADAWRLEEEGVIIAPTYLVKKGKVKWDTVERLFTTAAHPTRLWEENRADLNGALASIRYGVHALHALCTSHGSEKVTAFMRHLRTHAADMLRRTLRQMDMKNWRAQEQLDDGSLLHVAIARKGKGLQFDFNGSAGVHPGNLNATPAIVQSVVLYVLRLLVQRAIPMNEGLLADAEIILPKGLLNPDFSAPQKPAVVGGNTEVSQRLTDTLLKAFKLAACSQGTMNNFLFGNERFGYYETICGGTGAGPGFDGASAVHQHMTNTRITDPELLELRYPVRLVRFEIRKNSGGKGRWRGGDGVVREVLFEAELAVNMLSQHRVEKPYGLRGGLPGKPGRQYIIRSNGAVYKLKGMDSCIAYPGDVLVIETPGGGGFGRPTGTR